MSIFIVWPVLKFIFRGNAVLIFAAAALLDIYRESIAGYLDLDVFQIGILITYLPVFAFGAVICRTNREKLLSFEPLTFAATAFLGAALAALCISLKTTSLLETSPLRPFIYDIASLGGKIFGGVAVIKLSVIIARLLEKTGAFFAHLGRYSYDIYLYHILTLMIMITIVDKLNLSPSLTKAAASAVFIGAVAAAYAGCRIIRMNKRLSSVILGDPV
jgi:peptidoglycan/LPS O-acetylase OafA/YrhL